MVRRYFSMSGWMTDSPFNMRLVVDRSLRRLCIALNRFDDASAISEIRRVEPSPGHESHALTERIATTPMASRTMTDLSNADTVNPFNIRNPRHFDPARLKMVNISVFSGIF